MHELQVGVVFQILQDVAGSSNNRGRRLGLALRADLVLQVRNKDGVAAAQYLQSKMQFAVIGSRGFPSIIHNCL